MQLCIDASFFVNLKADQHVCIFKGHHETSLVFSQDEDARHHAQDLDANISVEPSFQVLFDSFEVAH